MKIDILTMFPDMFDRVFDASLLGRAREEGLVKIRIHDLWNWAKGSHGLDDRPYGGGPGMVLKPGPVVRGVEAIEDQTGPVDERILFSPRGKPLDQKTVEQLADETTSLLLICGRYEGFDERIRQILNPREISIGDYIVSGGEIPAMVLVDAVVRLLPGVVGDEDSVRKESFSTEHLDYPEYTRPRSFRGEEVPEVLLSGDHERIREWRQQKSKELTRTYRPDLLDEDHQTGDDSDNEK